MGGLWILECPNEGIYQGKCHRVRGKGKGFVLHCSEGLVKFKNPNDDTCEPSNSKANDNPRKFLPKGLTKCERQHPSVKKLLSRCIKALEPQEKAGRIRSAVAVCRRSIKCPP